MCKKLRYCWTCAKKVPNHRQERANTCSKKCSADWDHLSKNQRIEHKKIAMEKKSRIPKGPQTK